MVRTPAPFELVIRGLIGLRLQEMHYQRETERLELRFDAAWRFDVDLTNMWNTDGDLLELSLPDGRIIAVDSTGEIATDAGMDEHRAQRWNARLDRH